MEKYFKSAKIFYYEKIRKPVKPDRDIILTQLRETSTRLESAYSRFENECNEDLLDSVIYEIQSLKAHYRYHYGNQEPVFIIVGLSMMCYKIRKPRRS